MCIRDRLAGIVVAVVLKVLVWQKQADAKKLRKGIEYGSARWGNEMCIRDSVFGQNGMEPGQEWINMNFRKEKACDGK